MKDVDLADRKTLMASLPKGGIGAEIGVSEGLFSQALLDVCQPRLLYLIDPWRYQTGPLEEDASNVPQDAQEARHTAVARKFGPDPRVRLLRAFSLQASEKFSPNYFDWWHLDGDHTKAGQDLEKWWLLLKPGGWATGHDYMAFKPHLTVKIEVDAFVALHDLQLFVTRGETDIYEKNYPTWAIQKPL